MQTGDQIPNRETQNSPGIKPETQNGLAAAGSVITSLLASACCLVPLVLLSLGVTGAWIGNLTALNPYKPYFVAATIVFLALGFWYVYVKPRKDCEEGSYCASPKSLWITKAALWFSTILVILATTLKYWKPYIF